MADLRPQGLKERRACSLSRCRRVSRKCMAAGLRAISCGFPKHPARPVTVIPACSGGCQPCLAWLASCGVAGAGWSPWGHGHGCAARFARAPVVLDSRGRAAEDRRPETGSSVSASARVQWRASCGLCGSRSGQD